MRLFFYKKEEVITSSLGLSVLYEKAGDLPAAERSVLHE